MCENGTLESARPVTSLYAVHFDVQWLIFLLIFMAHY